MALLAAAPEEAYINDMLNHHGQQSQYRVWHAVAALAGLLVLFALPLSGMAHAETSMSLPRLHLPSADAPPTSICPNAPIDTVIHVKLVTPEPVINHTKSRNNLRDFSVSTKSPYGDGSMTHVNGLMRGPVELKTDMTIAWQTSPQLKQNCFWYRTITLVLRLKPTIYVAREIPEGTCYYNAIIQHEMKHVEVDRGLVRDYQNILYDTIENFVQHEGRIDNSPVGDENIAQKQLTDALSVQVQDIHRRMRDDRIDRQAKIDTLAEYNRVADECQLEEIKYQ